MKTYRIYITGTILSPTVPIFLRDIDASDEAAAIEKYKVFCILRGFKFVHYSNNLVAIESTLVEDFEFTHGSIHKTPLR